MRKSIQHVNIEISDAFEFIYYLPTCFFILIIYSSLNAILIKRKIFIFFPRGGAFI